MLNTQSMFSQLPETEQRKCIDTYETMKRLPDCRPDEWNHIVSYYYDLNFNSIPAGWFCWWED